MFYRHQPLSYIYDDHDVGSNNADGRSRTAWGASRAYARMIRDVPEKQEVLLKNKPGQPKWHSYEVPVGESRVIKFVVFDLIMMKNGTQNYGQEQITWLK